MSSPKSLIAPDVDTADQMQAVPAPSSTETSTGDDTSGDEVNGGSGLLAQAYSRRILGPVVLSMAVLMYVIFFSRRSIATHDSLSAGAYDMGIFDQGIWLLSRFQSPFSTIIGRQLFGDHASFSLAFLAPGYWLFPGSEFLLVAQTVGLASAVVPLYLTARRELGDSLASVAIPIAYLLHPSVNGANMENFHPDSFLAPMIAMAIYAAKQERWRIFVVSVVLALLTKEDTAFVIAPLGAWVFATKDRRIGLLTVFGSLAYMAIALLVFMPAFGVPPDRNAWRLPFGGIGGIVRTSFTEPTVMVQHLLSGQRPSYLLQMSLPFGWLFKSPLALASSIVVLINLVSVFRFQHEISRHYSIAAIPALAFAAIETIRRLEGRVKRLLATGFLLALSMYSSYFWAQTPWNPDYSHDWEELTSAPRVLAARDVVNRLPDDAAISGNASIVSFLAHRPEVYVFPNPFLGQAYGDDAFISGPGDPDRADRIDYILIERDQDYPYTHPDGTVMYGREEILPSFELIYEDEFWELYLRNPSVPVPQLDRIPFEQRYVDDWIG